MDENRLAEEYRSRILYFVLKRVRDRALAEEITQDALLVTIKAVRSGQIRDESSTGSYLFGVARNLILNNHRKLQRANNVADYSEKVTISWKDHPEAKLLLREQQMELQNAFDRLSDADKEILQQAFEGDEHSGNTSDSPTPSSPTLRKRKSRALERLRKLILNLSHKGIL